LSAASKLRVLDHEIGGPGQTDGGTLANGASRRGPSGALAGAEPTAAQPTPIVSGSTPAPDACSSSAGRRSLTLCDMLAPSFGAAK
jgi:hypothetical protein